MPQELSFLKAHPIHLIQWRNLNFDPLRYWKTVNRAAYHGAPIGMKRLVDRIKKEYPRVHHGYFNPPVA